MALLVFALIACGGPGTTPPPQNGNDNGNDNGNGDLASSLNALGVDTSPRDRVDPRGEPLPDTYAPLGGTAAFNAPEAFAGPTGMVRTDELFVIGPELSASASSISLVKIDGAVIDGDGGVVPGTIATLHTLDEAEEPWLADGSGGAQSNEGRSLRAAAAGDLTGDGLEETVIVYVDTTLAERTVRVLSIGHAESEFVRNETTIASGTGVLDVEVVTGDFDGDGTASVVVALGDEDGIDLLFLQGEPGSFSVDGSATKRLPASRDVDQVTVRMAVGNLDYDNPKELVVVVNELFDLGGGTLGGTSRFFVFDDATTGFAELESGDVTANVSGLKVALVADVAVGDVTGNGLDEIVLGGLTSFNMSCDDQPDALVTVLDGPIGGFTQVEATLVYAGFFNCPAFNPWRHRFFHVTTPDLDGDGVKAIQAGRYVFAGLHEEAPFTEVGQLPQDVFLAANGDAGAYVTTNTSTIAAADLTGDGRENIVTYHQWRDDIRVWGVSAIETVGFAELSRIATSFYNVQANVRPLLVPVNVDHDSAVLTYGAGTHELVFTEPLLIAVMAAAPCAEEIGQNLGGCSVTFGNAETATVTREFTVSASASAYVGVKTAVNVPWVGEVGADFKHKVSTKASLSTAEAYSVTTSRRFTSGPLEDAVVFSTIPYDRYVYDILSHPDPELIGGTVEVMVPREPIVLKVEREFYNERITEKSTAIGANVFDHTVGDLGSYPSSARKNALLVQYGGLENGPLSVGEGTGSTGLGIEVGTAVSQGGSLAVEYEYSVDVTAGPALAGFSVGFGAEASLTFTSGESTTFDVSVGDLSAESFADHQYSFGMFTYVQPIGGQEAEVINFWVQ